MDWNNPKTGIAFCGTIAAICNAAAFIHAISRKHERLGSVHEGRLLGLKIFRTLSYATLAISEGLILLLYLASDWSDRPLMSVQKLSAAVSWTIGVVCLMLIWPRQGSAMLMIPAECTLLMSSLLLANDALSSTESHGEDIMGLIVHSLQLLLLITLVLAEVVISQHVDTLLNEHFGEPLLPKEKKKKPGSPSNTRMAMTRKAFKYVWPDSSALFMRLVACFVLVLAERAVNLAVPLLYKNMVDKLSQVGSMDALAPLFAAALSRTDPDSPQQVELLKLMDGMRGTFWDCFYPWIFFYLGIYFLRGGSGFEGLLTNIRDIVWIPINQAAFRRVSLDVFGHLLDLDLKYHMHRKTGQIMRILDRGTSSIQDTVSIVLFNVIPQLLDIGVACTYLALYMQPWAAGIVFVTVSSYVPLTIIITERRGRIRKTMNHLDNAREGRATDMLLNYETVKFFSNEQFELDVYDSATRQYQSAEYWQMAFLSLLSIAQSLVQWVGLASGMVICVMGVVNGTLTVGDTVLFLTMMNQLYIPLTYFGSYYRQVQKALIDMENMFDLLATESLVKDIPGAQALQVKNGEVRFDHVAFSYKEGSLVLKGISFCVPGGKTMAVVGSTGSGKSTILRLLLRFYDPTSGRVVIDGQDIAQVQQASVRRSIAVVPQETMLFNDTVMYNIRYGRTDATDEEVKDAAAVAHIHESIMSCMKKGYSSRVGERGLRLSGGERQRVAFARAVLKKPSVLVLDEATSALDSLTERQIQNSLARMRSKCTTVIVAHRLSTIMDADMILVLDQGNVAEVGSHDELLEKDGLYASMWFHQKSTHAPSVTSASRAMSTTFDIIEDDEEGEDCEEGEEEGGGQSLAPNRMPRPPKNPMFTSGRLLSVLRSPGPSRFRSFSREGSVSGMMMDGDNTDDDRAATPGKQRYADGQYANSEADTEADAADTELLK